MTNRAKAIVGTGLCLVSFLSFYFGLVWFLRSYYSQWPKEEGYLNLTFFGWIFLIPLVFLIAGFVLNKQVLKREVFYRWHFISMLLVSLLFGVFLFPYGILIGLYLVWAFLGKRRQYFL